MTYPQNDQPTQPMTPSPPKRPTARQWVIPFAVVGAIVTAIVIGSETGAETGAPAVPSSTMLELAREACTAGDLSDGGRTIVLDMEGDEYGTGDLTFDQVTCVLGVVGVPTSVASRMDSTRALDGMQDAEWDGFAASWTYHPDDGLDVIITEN